MAVPKFLWLKWLLFPLPLLIVFAIAEHGLERKPNVYADKKQMLEREAPRVEALVSGSSHAYYGIDPALFDWSAVNLGCDSQDLYYDTSLLLKYAPQMPQLKLTIVCLSYFSFDYRLDESSDAWRTTFYSRIFGISGMSGSAAWNHLRANWLFTYGPRESFAWYIDHPAYVPVESDLGWGLESAVHSRTEQKARLTPEAGRKRVAYVHTQMSPNCRTSNVALVEKICAVLQSRGVQVVFVTTPVSRSYADAVSPERCAVFQDFIAQISAHYHVPYRNYMRDSRFNQDDFYDSDHLNAEGARKFSLILNEEILRRYLPASAKLTSLPPQR